MEKSSKPKRDVPILVVALMTLVMIGGILMYETSPRSVRTPPSPVVTSNRTVRTENVTIPPGTPKGYCEPEPKFFENIKSASGASQAAELDGKKTLNIFAMMRFRMEREASWKNPDPTVVFPRLHPPYAPNQLPNPVPPKASSLVDRNGEVRPCFLIPFSFGFKVYDEQGRLMGLTEVSSFTWYEYPGTF